MFDALWEEFERINSGYAAVQRKEEARTVFHLLKGLEAKSYLEIGSSLGGSLWIYAHALQNGGRVLSIDLESRPRLVETVRRLKHKGFDAELRKGDSTTISLPRERFDVIFIDGGHDLSTVKSDYERFSDLADNLVLFHDIEAPGPKSLMNDIHPRVELRQPESFGLMGYGLVWK